MAFDFTAAVQTALSSTGNGDGEKTYKYKLVYPQKGGVLTLRLLFNPKSNLITRLVQRHEKVACLRTYGKSKEECPICKMQEDVKNTTGMDPFAKTSATKSRGVSFAQFISSTVPIEGVNPGDNIVFMYPWSVYQQINQMIQATAQSPTGMDMAFCHSNNGMFIQITVTNDFKYSCVQLPYMTFTNGMTDEQFIEMLNNMDSLNDQVLPAQITEEVMKQVNEYAQEIYKQYLEPKTTPTYGVPQNTAPIGFNTVPQQTNVVPPQPTAPQPVPSVPFNQPYTSTPLQNVVTPAITPIANFAANPTVPVTPVISTNAVPNTANSVPACFGQHVDGEPKCICCPVEVQCLGAKK